MTSQLSIYFSLFAVHLRISSCVFSQDSDDLRLCWILTLLVPWNQDSVCLSQLSSLLGKFPFFYVGHCGGWEISAFGQTEKQDINSV